MHMSRCHLAVGFATVLLAGLLAPIVAADDTVPLGGGAGITVNGTNCTLATIGHDNTGELVGFTAATCGGPGSQIAAAGGPQVGSVVASDDYLDYAVIKLDQAKITPTANFAGFAINGIGPADPDRGQAVCTDGAATGNQCGHITTLAGTGRGRNMAGCTFQPGDEGRPVTADNLLIGVARDGWVTHGDLLYGGGGMPESHLTLFSAILADVNAKGGPGAGFSPIPA
jgi:hypothetical protein